MFKEFLSGIYQKGEKLTRDEQKRPIIYESFRRIFWFIVITKRVKFKYYDSPIEKSEG